MMAIYDFKCTTCKKMIMNKVLPITHVPTDLPMCCDRRMGYHITKAPMVHYKDYQLPDGGFKAHGVVGAPVVTSMKQRKDMMDRHGLIDANEFGPPPTMEDQIKHNEEVVQPSVAEVSLTNDQKDRMRYDGLGDIVDIVD